MPATPFFFGQKGLLPLSMAKQTPIVSQAPSPKHWIVAIDMSANQGSLSLFGLTDPAGTDMSTAFLDEELVLSSNMKHSEELFDGLQRLLAPRNLHPKDISQWWSNQGPGSFTGLRIALAAVKGACTATGARLVMCDGAEARALSWLRAEKVVQPMEVRVCTQSTATKYIVQTFRWEDSKLSKGETIFVEEVPKSREGSVVLADAEHDGSICWPSRSSFLPFAQNIQVLVGAAPIAQAAPTYYASRAFVKAAVG